MISVIVPSYNEEKNLAVNLPVLERYLNTHFRDYEVIVVDDGSKDRTRNVAEGLARKNSRIKMISYKKNMGRGYAVREGMRRARYNHLFMMDADMPTAMNLDIVREMLDKLKTNDVVIASRFIEGSSIKRKVHRAILSAVYRRLVKIVFQNFGISDTDSGLKAFRREAALEIAEKTKENRWSWDLEAMIFARKERLRITELPLEWNEDGSSTINLFIDPAEQFFGVMKTRLKYGKI